MALARYSFTLLIDVNDDANIGANQPIEIKDKGTANLSSIFSDEAGLNPITQPGLTTDSNGNTVFYAEAAEYDVYFGGVFKERIDAGQQAIRNDLSSGIADINGKTSAEVSQSVSRQEFQVRDFSESIIYQQESSYASAPNSVIQTGQSLAEGGVGGDVVSGVYSARYPFEALMISPNPVGAEGQILSSDIVSLKESSRVTIGSSLARDIVERKQQEFGQKGFKFIFSGAAWGGKTYDELRKGGSTGVYEECIRQAGVHNSAMPNGTTFKAVTIIHGEADGLINNTNYAANLVSWRDDFTTDLKSVSGQVEDPEVLLCQTATAGGYGFNGGITETDFPAPIEQYDAALNSARISMVCSKYFLPYFDQSHITNAGQIILGEYYAKAYKTIIEDGQSFNPLRPLSVTGSSNTVVIDFIGNVGNLVFDETIVQPISNKGFDYVDDSGNTITNVQITGASQVTITLSGAIGANPIVSYAYHNGAGGASNQAAGLGDRGNLRDSDTTPSKFYQDYPSEHNGYEFLYNWCVIFRLPVTI